MHASRRGQADSWSELVDPGRPRRFRATTNRYGTKIPLADVPSKRWRWPAPPVARSGRCGHKTVRAYATIANSRPTICALARCIQQRLGGLNNKATSLLENRTDLSLSGFELGLYHSLGRQPELESAHDFFRTPFFSTSVEICSSCCPARGSRKPNATPYLVGLYARAALWELAAAAQS